MKQLKIFFLLFWTIPSFGHGMGANYDFTSVMLLALFVYGVPILIVIFIISLLIIIIKNSKKSKKSNSKKKESSD